MLVKCLWTRVYVTRFPCASLYISLSCLEFAVVNVSQLKDRWKSAWLSGKARYVAIALASPFKLVSSRLAVNFQYVKIKILTVRLWIFLSNIFYMLTKYLLFVQFLFIKMTRTGIKCEHYWRRRVLKSTPCTYKVEHTTSRRT